MAGGGGAGGIQVLILINHHIVVMMADQEHQVDQDLVVVKMELIMDLLVLVQAVLQVVILVQLMEHLPLVTLVVAAVAQVVLVKMALDLDHNKLGDPVVQVFNFLPLSVIPVKLLDKDLEVQLHTTG